MRELKFYVNGQRIKKDNTCDFSGIVAGTKGYLEAVFCFGSDWSGMSKVAVFTRLKEQHPAKIIKINVLFRMKHSHGETFRFK